MGEKKDPGNIPDPQVMVDSLLDQNLHSRYGSGSRKANSWRIRIHNTGYRDRRDTLMLNYLDFNVNSLERSDLVKRFRSTQDPDTPH
jgi:hypothetical protein